MALPNSVNCNYCIRATSYYVESVNTTCNSTGYKIYSQVYLCSRCSARRAIPHRWVRHVVDEKIVTNGKITKEYK